MFATRSLFARACALTVCVVMGGCGAVRSRSSIARAEDALTRAQGARADSAAPYEYTFAAEHLKKAREEAMRAEHDDAREHAEVATDYAERALAASQALAADEGHDASR